MREIKFRVWDIENKRMVVPYSIALLNTYAGIQQYHDVHYLEGDMCIEPENAIILQYTGLKDKNGKEIYEGDIVSREYNSDIGLISFINGCFVASFIYSDIDTSCVLVKACSTYQVLGNIYENPELLEDKK